MSVEYAAGDRGSAPFPIRWVRRLGPPPPAADVEARAAWLDAAILGDELVRDALDLREGHAPRAVAAGIEARRRQLAIRQRGPA